MKKLQHHVALPEQVDILKLDVALNNALNLASQGLSLFEKRLVSAALAKMNQPTLPKDFKDYPWAVHEANWDDWMKVEDSPFSVIVSADDYAKAGNLDISTAYTQLKQAIESLWDAQIRMKVQTSTGIKPYSFRWISGKAYHEGEGYAELFWSPQVVPHIFDLKKKFTAYKLAQSANLESLYSIRLFEQFVGYAPGKSLKNAGVYHPSIEEFNDVIGVPDAYRKDFAGIRRRIIEKAVADLQDKLQLKIDWTAKYRGRKVVGLEFRYGPAQAGDQSVYGDFTDDEEHQ